MTAVDVSALLSVPTFGLQRLCLWAKDGQPKPYLIYAADPVLYDGPLMVVNLEWHS